MLGTKRRKEASQVRKAPGREEAHSGWGEWVESPRTDRRGQSVPAGQEGTAWRIGWHWILRGRLSEMPGPPLPGTHSPGSMIRKPGRVLLFHQLALRPWNSLFAFSGPQGLICWEGSGLWGSPRPFQLIPESSRVRRVFVFYFQDNH